MGKRILVVDDSATVRRVVSGVLTKRGYDVATAADGALALSTLVAANPKFDLAVIDLHMPRVNGLQLCRAMRGNPELATTRIVLMSASSSKLGDPEVVGLPSRAVISKPFTSELLTSAVESAFSDVVDPDAARVSLDEIVLDGSEVVDLGFATEPGGRRVPTVPPPPPAAHGIATPIAMAPYDPASVIATPLGMPPIPPEARPSDAPHGPSAPPPTEPPPPTVSVPTNLQLLASIAISPGPGPGPDSAADRAESGGERGRDESGPRSQVDSLESITMPSELLVAPKLGDMMRANVPPVAAGTLRNAEGRVVLTADLASVQFGAILQLLQLESKTGVLSVHSPSGSIVVHMRQGLIDLARSRGSQGEFKLGRYLIEEGVVVPDELDALIKAQAEGETKTPIGDLLVSRGKATEQHLRDALSRQASELVYEALRWEEGTISFALAPAEALAVSARLALPVASVVMEGFRRVDEWRLMEAKVGMDDVVIKDVLSLEQMGEGQLSKSETTVLDAIDGKRTVRELIDTTYMSSFDVCRAVYQFLEARLVRRRG